MLGLRSSVAWSCVRRVGYGGAVVPGLASRGYSSSATSSKKGYDAATKTWYSPHPSIDIPNVPLTEYVISNFSSFENKPSLVDAITGHSYTYKQLKHVIFNTGTNLQKRGFKKGDVVGIYAHNCLEWPVMFHGSCLVGAIPTPVGPQHGADEVAEQLIDCNAKALVTSAELLPSALRAAKKANINEEHVYVIGDVEQYTAHLATSVNLLLQGDGTAPKKPAIDPRVDIAALPYSSGTTGKPKGVMLSHYNLVANIAQAVSVEKYTSSDRLIGILPFWHIYGTTLIMNIALYCGAQIATLAKFNIDSFLKALEDYKVNIAHLAPPLIVVLGKHPAVANYDLSNLKMIFSGAAPLGSSTEEECKKRIGCQVKQAYGMTELSPGSHITPNDKIKPGSIGPTLPNTICRIVDLTTEQPVGPNEVGEIRLKGPQVMLGYLNKPEETKNNFDADGFYKTGDTGRYDEDGYAYIVCISQQDRLF